jgi:phage tail-like protein
MATGERPQLLPGHQFGVEIDSINRAKFQQVSGLEITVETTEYNEGGRPSPLKIPGLVKYSDITLRYGVIRDAELYDWIKDVVDGRVRRRDGSVVQYDATGVTEVYRWNFFDAWPTKLTAGEFNAQTSTVMVDVLVLAHERLERA